jgi:hypothetical protein
MKRDVRAGIRAAETFLLSRSNKKTGNHPAIAAVRTPVVAAIPLPAERLDHNSRAGGRAFGRLESADRSTILRSRKSEAYGAHCGFVIRWARRSMCYCRAGEGICSESACAAVLPMQAIPASKNCGSHTATAGTEPDSCDQAHARIATESLGKKPSIVPMTCCCRRGCLASSLPHRRALLA